MEGQLDFRYLATYPGGDAGYGIQRACRDIIFYMAMTGDITGKTYNPRDVAERLSQVSKGPVFGLYETLLGHGITGAPSSGMEHRHSGRPTGSEYPRDRFRFEKTSEVLDVPGLPMFDWRELKRWNLSVARCRGKPHPEQGVHDLGLQILHVGALAFCLAETALIIFFIVQRRRRGRQRSR